VFLSESTVSEVLTCIVCTKMEPGTLKIVIEDHCYCYGSLLLVLWFIVHRLAVAGAAGVAGAWFIQTPYNVYRSLS